MDQPCTLQDIAYILFHAGRKAGIPFIKMGYYYADEEIFEEIQKETGTNGSRHPLAFILEAADDMIAVTNLSMRKSIIAASATSIR